jgi:hypothetical protein
MFASDHPLLEIAECGGDLADLDLPAKMLAAYGAEFGDPTRSLARILNLSIATSSS